MNFIEIYYYHRPKKMTLVGTEVSGRNFIAKVV